jgi:hypothetical protein
VRQRTVVNLGSLLGLTSLVIVVAYGHSNVLLAGALYIAVATGLAGLSVSTAVLATSKRKSGIVDVSLEIRSQFVILIAWQIAIVGMLNILASDVAGSRVLSIVAYLLAGLFFVDSYRLVAMADSPIQSGGYIPLNFFGQPRTRRSGFAIFSVTCVLLPLAGSSIKCDIEGVSRPYWSQDPQVCLLMSAMMSVISCVFLYERYRRKVTERYDQNIRYRSKSVVILVSVVSILACLEAIRAIGSYSRYTYVLSAIALIGSAFAVSCLWRVGEHSQGELMSGRTT